MRKVTVKRDRKEVHLIDRLINHDIGSFHNIEDFFGKPYQQQKMEALDSRDLQELGVFS